MKKVVKRIAGIVALLVIVSMFISYNNRPLTFEDNADTKSNPIQEFFTNAGDRIAEAGEGFELPDFFNGEDTDTPAPNTNVDLSQVKVSEPYYNTYNRDDFGSGWMDPDANGCDSRNDILARDLTEITKSDSCTVTSGILADDYTGEIIHFTRGESTVDIDHIVPLSYAARQAANMWPQDKREAFANDPMNLAASSASANRSKGDKGPSEWMPDNVAFHCEYGMQFAAVAVKYDMPITPADYNGILAACG